MGEYAGTVLTVVGYAVGSYFGYPQLGALIGAAVGYTLQPDLPTQHGPRISDRRVQQSSFGNAVPYLFGANRIAGTVIWSADLEEVATEHEQGGKGGPSQTTVTYSYYGTFAVMFGFGRCRAIRRIWADAVLLYDSSTDAPVNDVDFAWYGGSEEQLPDATIEAAIGVGNTPAYRGYAYAVFKRMALERFGNRIPSITAEVVADGEWSFDSTDVGAASASVYTDATQRADGQIVALSEPSEGVTRLRVIDPETGAVTLQVDHAMNVGTHMCYVPPIEQVWVGRGGYIERFDAHTLAHVGTVTVAPGWNGLTLAYEPVNRMVNVHRASSQVGSQTYCRVTLEGRLFQWLFFGGIGYGMFYCTELVTGGSQVVIGTGGLNQFGVLRTVMGGVFNMVVATQATAGNAGCWDPHRKRYVVISNDTVYTVNDSLTPTITAYTPEGFSGSAAPRQVQYIGGLDVIVLYKSIVGIVSMSVLDADTFEVLAQSGDVVEEVNRNGVTRAFPHLSDPGMVFGVGTYQPYNVALYGSTVGAAVARLCRESGLQASDYNVAELSQRLRGYLVSQLGPARGAIEQLANAFLFEGVEQDDVLYFRRRGGATVAAVSASECGAGVDEAGGHAITKTRGQEADLPAKLFITAPDPATDYQPGTQYAERQAANAGDDEHLQFAVVLTTTEARRLADALLFDLWAGRGRRAWSTTRKFARLVPSDPITLDGERVRIINRSDEGSVIRWEGITDDPEVIEQSITGVQGSFPRQIVVSVVPTTMIVLDIALLRDADDHPGAYVAAYGVPPYWRGGVVFSTSDGVSWERKLTIPRPGSAIGTATNALGNWTGGNVFDEKNRLNVTLFNGSAESTTREGVLNGSNALAIEGPNGWEVLQYRDAVLEDNGTYTLTGLLRGRRGTEYAMAGHASGNRVVLLSTTLLRDMTIDSSAIGIERVYRAVSIGDTLAETPDQSVTITAERLRPWSPVQVGGGRNAAGDVLMQWKRRTRVGGEWRDSVDASLGESTEAYEVDIYTNGERSTVARTITGLSAPSATYTSAQQTADFGAPQASVYWAAFQMSATVGRGHGAHATT